MSRLQHLSRTHCLSTVAGLALVVVALWSLTASRVDPGASSAKAHLGSEADWIPIPPRTVEPVSIGSTPEIHASEQPTSDSEAAPRFKPNPGASSALARHRAEILRSVYGTAPIQQVLHALVETPGGPEIQLILQALALRKAEALPMVKARLRTGELWEKVMLTKFLVHCAWPETLPELLVLARTDTESSLVRQGAVSAVGALGNPAAGPDLVAILREPKNSGGLSLAAIAALANINYREGNSVLRSFAQHEDPHLRLFAARALAELGELVDPEPIKSAMDSSDYVIRLEACEALGAMDGADHLETLQAAARNDVHEAVRQAAAQAMLTRQLRGQTRAEKVLGLQSAMADAGRLTSLWIVRTLLREGGPEGRALVETVGAEDTWLGERCRVHLILAARN